MTERTPPLASHLLLECLCWAPEGAVCELLILGPHRARVSYNAYDKRSKKLLRGLLAPPTPPFDVAGLGPIGGWPAAIAASEFFMAIFRRATDEWRHRFRQGVPWGSQGRSGEGGPTCTLFYFQLDPELVTGVFDVDWIREWAVTVTSLSVTVTTEGRCCADCGSPYVQDFKTELQGPDEELCRGCQKQRSRDEDYRRLAAGEVTREQLTRENAFLDASRATINWKRLKNGRGP